MRVSRAIDFLFLRVGSRLSALVDAMPDWAILGVLFGVCAGFVIGVIAVVAAMPSWILIAWGLAVGFIAAVLWAGKRGGF